jgi:hypothetical protein
MFRLAAICGIIPLAVLVFDIVVTMVYGAAQTTDRTAVAWIDLFQRNVLLGLQGLSFPQFVSVALGIPFFVALYFSLRDRGAALALLSLILMMVGAAMFLATNAALPMMALSERHAGASEAEKATLVAAAEAVLARGTDFTPAGCGAFVLQGIAGLLISALMIGAKGFGRWRGWLGLAGFSVLMVFIIGASFIPGGFMVLMPVSILGGMASMVWNLAVALSLWRLAKGNKGER